MRCLTSAAILANLAGNTLAATHDLIVGTFSGASLYTVRFDDEALTLERVGTTSVPYPNSWIALSVSTQPRYYIPNGLSPNNNGI